MMNESISLKSNDCAPTYDFIGCEGGFFSKAFPEVSATVPAIPARAIWLPIPKASAKSVRPPAVDATSLLQMRRP
jgi:hypothetical protein